MESVHVDGGELKALASGTGEPVLFIHGSLMADSYDCLRRYPALADRYRMITYRRRGFCDSAAHAGPCSITQQADDAAAVLDHFGVERAHVVGHSYGGVTALQLALDAPGRVRSLGLFEPAPTEVPAWAEFGEGIAPIAGLYMNGDGRAAAVAFLEAVGGAGYEAHFDRNLPAGWFDAMVGDIATFFEVELPALAEWSFGEDEASRVDVPALSVLGADSSELFVQGDAWYRRHLPSAEGFKLAGATHFLQAMNPADAATALADFLARHPM